MDEPKPLNRRRFDRLLRSFLFICATLIPGCMSPERNGLSRISGSEFDQLAQSLAQRRNLTLPRNFRLETEAAPFPIPTEYYGSVPLGQIERIYKNIGLLAAEDDFAAAWAEYQTIIGLAAFDRAHGVVRLARAALGLAAPWEKTDPAAARAFPAVVGAMQALQEQRFNWSRSIFTSEFEDRRLALRAVAIGDILLTATRLPDGSDNQKISAKELAMMRQVAEQIEKSAARLPDFFQGQAVFPYRHGGEFVSWAYSARGWPGVNGLYENPPASTAQVLHPEKYFIQRENPLRFFPAALLRRQKDRAILEQSLGEFSLGILLRLTRSPGDAAETAKAWRGDQLFSFPTDNGMAVFWFSSWRDETSARVFVRAYQEVLQVRQKLRFEPVQQAKDPTLIANGRDRRAWLLQNRGSLVLAVVGTSVDQLTQAAEQAWQDLEIEPEAAGVRFESANSAINSR